MGRERSRVLAVRCADPVLSVLAPVGLAATRGTALVVDLVGEMGSGGRTLADMAKDGPRLEELSPGRPGVALLGSGHLSLDDVVALVDDFATRWPAVVVRAGTSDWPGPTVPVWALYPGWLAPMTREPAVWQKLPAGPPPPGPGPVLPLLGSGVVRRVLSGGLPGHGRWVRAWRQVWELPWA
jgi:hypothetical protein